jgi:hypothetical protein
MSSTLTPTFSVTDTQLNTWAAATNQATNASQKSQVFWTYASASAANTVRFTRTGAASTDERVIWIAEFSGVTATNPVDASNTGTAATASPSINVQGSALTTIGVGVVYHASNASAGATWTELGVQDGNDAE